MLSDTRRRPGTLDCPQLACGMKSASGECGAPFANYVALCAAHVALAEEEGMEIVWLKG